MRRICATGRRLLSRDGLLLARALVLVIGIRLGLRVLPFGILDRLLQRLGSASAGAGQEAGDDPVPRAAWAVRAVARRLLPKRPCLTQALALRVLLGRRGRQATLRIGVRRGRSGTLEAHAWLEHEGHILIGGTDAPMRYPGHMMLGEGSSDA